MSDDLLPSNSTKTERTLSLVGSRILDVPTPIRDVWSPANAPESVLPWLAWALSVDSWDKDWTIEEKRRVIASAPITQKIKGTIGAVKQVLAALGLDIEVQEWFNQMPAGDPFTFRVNVNIRQAPASLKTLNKMLDIIETNKNLRSHLTQIYLFVNTASAPSVAAVSMVGSEITVTNYYVPVDFAALNDFVLPQI